MSGIPAGSIVHMGGRTVINRLQDAGLQDPRVPTQTIYETGNDLVVGKVLTEADFRFQMTSWDVSCDLMALLTGESTTLGNQVSGGDADGTEYKWEDVGFINVVSPWKDNVGTDGGDVSSGVIVPNLYPSQLSYRLGVTDMAQMQVTLSTGSYFMDGNNFPLEEQAAGDGTTTAFDTSEPANAYRIGGAGSTNYAHVFGVMVDHVPQIPGIDYAESDFADPEVTPTTGTITFAVAPPNDSLVQFCYFSTTAHAIPQEDNLAASATLPAAVRGRDITVLLGDPTGDPATLFGVQSVELTASCTGALQRQMGTQDPIGYARTGVDCSGTVTIEPKDKAHLFESMALTLGLDQSEVLGYINQATFPVTFVIHEPGTANIIKSIFVPDGMFQAPGENARVQTVTQYPIRFESFTGTFSEFKGELPS